MRKDSIDQEISLQICGFRSGCRVKSLVTHCKHGHKETLQHPRWIKKDFVKCWQLAAILVLPRDVSHKLTQAHSSIRLSVFHSDTFNNIVLKLLCGTRTHALPHPAFLLSATSRLQRTGLFDVSQSVQYSAAWNGSQFLPINQLHSASRLSPSQQHQTANILPHLHFFINRTSCHLHLSH